MAGGSGVLCKPGSHWDPRAAQEPPLQEAELSEMHRPALDCLCLSREAAGMQRPQQSATTRVAGVSMRKHTGHTGGVREPVHSETALQITSVSLNLMLVALGLLKI